MELGFWATYAHPAHSADSIGRLVHRVLGSRPPQQKLADLLLALRFVEIEPLPANRHEEARAGRVFFPLAPEHDR